MNAPFDKSGRKLSPYVFHGQTTSLCPECFALVPAKIIFDDGNVYYLKRCKAHGVSKVLLSTDIPYFKLAQDYIMPGDRPHVFQTRTEECCSWSSGFMLGSATVNRSGRLKACRAMAVFGWPLRCWQVWSSCFRVVAAGCF